jgi:hypothetical protein
MSVGGTKMQAIALSRMNLDRNPLILMAVGFTIGFAALATAELIRPAPPPQKSVATVAAQEPVRIVGTRFVPNVNPREH